jgi:hypothetical protein
LFFVLKKDLVTSTAQSKVQSLVFQGAFKKFDNNMTLDTKEADTFPADFTDFSADFPDFILKTCGKSIATFFVMY